MSSELSHGYDMIQHSTLAFHGMQIPSFVKSSPVGRIFRPERKCVVFFFGFLGDCGRCVQTFQRHICCRLDAMGVTARVTENTRRPGESIGVEARK